MSNTVPRIMHGVGFTFTEQAMKCVESVWKFVPGDETEMGGYIQLAPSTLVGQEFVWFEYSDDEQGTLYFGNNRVGLTWYRANMNIKKMLILLLGL